MPRQEPQQIATRIAANIRAARLARGLAHKDLAALLDVDQMYISRWERPALRTVAKPVTPSLKYLSRLADVLGHDVSWFYVDHGHRFPQENAA